MKKQTITETEYSIIGNDVEEHFEHYEDAEKFLSDYTPEQQMDMQFFEKEWLHDNGKWNEGNVKIIKNYGEHL